MAMDKNNLMLPVDFGTVFVDPRTGILTPYWQRKFSKLFTGPVWDSVVSGSDESSPEIASPQIDLSNIGSGIIAAIANQVVQQAMAEIQSMITAQIQVMTKPAIDPVEQMTVRIPLMEEPVVPAQRTWSIVTLIQDTAANLTNYTAGAYQSAYYIETDTFVVRRSDGSGWTEIIAPALIKLLGSTNSFPALKRSGTIIQIRLADDSAYSDLEVLDEAYDATTWNGVVEVPTKNAVRDKFEQLAPSITDALVSDAAYGAGWDGVTDHAPSKNAVYDKVETLLSKNGVNYGPAAVATITVVDGQITAIA